MGYLIIDIFPSIFYLLYLFIYFMRVNLNRDPLRLVGNRKFIVMEIVLSRQSHQDFRKIRCQDISTDNASKQAGTIENICL